jgi:putative alpha-1,2-mannosidase
MALKRVSGGHTLTIEAKRQSAKSKYIRSVEWNGSTVNGLTVEHAQLAKGGALVFHLVDEAPAVA